MIKRKRQLVTTQTPPPASPLPFLTLLSLVLLRVQIGGVLYDGVKRSVHNHLSAVGLRVGQKPDSELLAEVSKCWCDHQLKMVMVRDSICMYMDRTYVTQKKEKPVYDLGLQIFRETIWEHPGVRGRLQVRAGAKDS